MLTGYLPEKKEDNIKVLLLKIFVFIFDFSRVVSGKLIIIGTIKVLCKENICMYNIFKKNQNILTI